MRIAREVISPNVCRIYDLVVEELQELVSMEFIDGMTLASLIQNRGPLQLSEATEIASQFLVGLEAIHQAGFVHRDFKPENIMITRTGRVVVMDFGVTRHITQPTQSIAGTPFYMSPEQLQGKQVDHRTDIFAAGIVLAEMSYNVKSERESFLAAIRTNASQLHDHLWKKVIERAVAKDPEQRFKSVAALLRAIQEINQQSIASADSHNPYPGLSSFTEADAEFFFGRELEVEDLLKKIDEFHLLALIGSSGSGKTSLLQAGVIPALPENWSCILTQPGDSPFLNLAHALVSEFSGDQEAVHKMLKFEDSDVALSLLKRWRQNHSQVLLVVDRFEELFTLNDSQSQTRFSELLNKAALESDIRVLLAMRDDFLMHCHQHSGLIPIFSALTGLSPLSGPALRRALVEPALKCGYRFEDEQLVEEILGDVEKERGALPLMAFAAARMFEKRDRDSGMLTRQAYQKIGGVAGSLAHHAESTMEQIGADKHDVVREIFRNLITAQGTRAARDQEELLSVFSNRKDAEETLRTLIDARLLTSFEVKQEEKRRVEIIHESLLTAWPRLVRWQTQDADSAQLRDQLRQAAHLWDQRNRSTDLLWTGTSFLEFQAWRERYPGGLTSLEEAFAQAMVQRATKSRRIRRMAVAAIFVILLSILIVISSFWRGEKSARWQSDAARQQAVSQAQHREAAQLLALGRLKIADYPTKALAFAIASLEKADTPEGRRFALEALSQGPTAFVLPEAINSVSFSPDGKWLATSSVISGIQLWSRDGSIHKKLVRGDQDQAWPDVGFTPNSRILAGGWKDIRMWSIPDLEEISKTESVFANFYLRQSNLITFRSKTIDSKELEFRSFPISGGKSEFLGTLATMYPDFGIDSTGEWIAFGRGDGIFTSRLEELTTGNSHLLGRHRSKMNWVSFHSGNHITTADTAGEIRIWNFSQGSGTLKRIIQAKPPNGNFYIDLDASGSRLVASESSGHSNTTEVASVWDLSAPQDADSLVLRAVVNWLNTLNIHPDGKWLATANAASGMLWSLHHKFPYVLRGQSPPNIRVAFTPDCTQLVSCSDDGTVRTWPLSGKTNDKARILLNEKDALFGGFALSVDPSGKNILTTSRFEWSAYVLPLSGGVPQLMPAPPRPERFALIGSAAFGPDGRTAAVSLWPPPKIRIWKVDSKVYSDLDTRIGDEDCGFGKDWAGWVSDLKFTSDGRLVTGGTTGLRIWDIDKQTSKLIRPCKRQEMYFSLSSDGGRLLMRERDMESSDIKPSVLSAFDLERNRSWEITSHGNLIYAVAIDPSGKLAVTGDSNGVVRVGPITGEEPHLLFGHTKRISSVAVSRDGKWIASASDDGTIRIWPMPQGQPFHTLPYKELLKRLRSFTNLRVVADNKADTGYKIEVGRFPGWERVPEW